MNIVMTIFGKKIMVENLSAVALAYVASDAIGQSSMELYKPKVGMGDCF